MDQNDFDNQQNQMPRDGGEHFDIYNLEKLQSRGATAQKKKRGVGKRVAVAAISAVILVVFFMTAVLVSTFAVSSYYNGLLDEAYSHQQAAHDDRKPLAETGAVTGTEPKAETEKAPVFSAAEDTKIELSESPSVTVDGKVGDSDLSIADVVALVSNSVVEITTSETLRNGLVYESGAGSGVIVNESGVIVTNNHVLASGTDISVRLTNGNVYKATVVAADEQTDIAIIKIDPKEELVAATRGNSDNIVVGEEILAIGNPLGVLGGTVTNGIISARERELSIDGEIMTLLQHNAAISPGNSGGALFNMRGELIGIVNAKYLSSEAEGLGFAIPMNTVYEVYCDLIEYGYVRGRADHGITIATGRYYVFQGDLYIYSSRYTEELKYGDRLLSIGGVAPTGLNHAYELLEAYKIGDEVSITIVRNGTQADVILKIQEYTPEQ